MNLVGGLEHQNGRNCKGSVSNLQRYPLMKSTKFDFFRFSEWQDEPTLFLIEFIKAHPSIWDTTDVMYRNVRMNKNLFLELVNVLGNKYPDHGYTYGKFSKN